MNTLFVLLSLLGTSPGDSTQTYLKNLMNEGGKEVQTVQASSVTGHYYISSTAQKIIDTKQFDVQDPNFDPAIFNQYVVKTLNWALDYYSKNISTTVTEMHFILNDLGDARQGTVCETFVNSRYVQCDIRRVHKMYLGYRGYLFPLVLVHEYTHANQYANMGYPEIPQTSSEEGRPLAHDRELKAIAVEIPATIEHEGPETAYVNYVKAFQSMCTPAAFNLPDETMLKQTGRRCLMLALWALLNNKTLAEKQASERTIPSLITELLIKTSMNKQPGMNALTDEATKLGIERSVDHAPLTYSVLKEEALKLFPAAQTN